MKKLTQFLAVALLVAGSIACTKEDPAPVEPAATSAPAPVETTGDTTVTTETSTITAETPAVTTDTAATTVTTGTETTTTEPPANPPAQQ